MPQSEIRLDQLELDDLGLDDSVVERLLDKFEVVSDITDAPITEIMKVEGIGRTTATNLREQLQEIEQQVSEEEEEKGSVIGSRPLADKELSREEAVQFEDQLKAKEREESEKEYVMVEDRVDQYFVYRKRIEVGPATCRECGYDVISVNKLPDWDELSSLDQSRVKETLNQHMTRYHSTPSNKRILTESQLKDTNWQEPVNIIP